MKVTGIKFFVTAFCFFTATSAFADSVAVFAFDAVNASPEVAEAAALTMAQEFESSGFKVVMGENIPKEMTVPAVEESAAETESSKEASGDENEEPLREAQAQEVSPVVSPEAMSAAALGAGCRFYIAGSLVQLGRQMTITTDLFFSDGARIAGKKIVSPDETALPGAIRTLSSSIVEEMNRYRPAPKQTQDPRTEEATAPEKPSPDVKGFQKNFGAIISQTFGVSDEMYSFITFAFNGRFEFNRLLMTANAGFSLGNEEPAEGFHFSLNLSLSAYLLKTQVTPYLGGGFGFYIGNRMNRCRTNTYEDSGHTYEEKECSDEGMVGWDVFPVLGLEILRTMFLRVHLEGRYLMTFNGYNTWGHGPVVMVGVAF
jgi:hypothetical protein